MSVSATLENTKYADGTTVYAYDATGYPDGFPGANPAGTPVAETEANGHTVEFTGLTANTPYLAAGKVGGRWVYRRFIPEAEDPASLHPTRGPAGVMGDPGPAGEDAGFILNRVGSALESPRLAGGVNVWIAVGTPANMEPEDILIDETPLSAEDIEGLGNAAGRDVGTTAGTVAAGDDPRFSEDDAASVAEVEAEEKARKEADATKQPLDSDLTAIAALTTTSFGRSLLELANAAAGRTALGLGTASVEAASAFQPADSDLTAIAALTTTAFGRGLLALANAAAVRAEISAASISEAEERTVGPASATTNDIVVFSGTTGKVVKDGAKTIAQVLERANHTGTQTASTVSDFDTQVRTSRLDQMAKPTADVSMGKKKLTEVAEPAGSEDAVNKAYLETQTGLLIPKSLVDAKGDLLVGTADNTVTRRAVGSNGQLLQAASGESDGVKWAKVAAANLGDLGLGSQHSVSGYMQSIVSNAPGAKAITFLPVKIPQTCPLTGIVYEVGSTKNGKVIAGLYNAAGERLRKSASVEQSTAEFFQRVAFESTLEVEPGIYWLSLTMETATGTFFGTFQSSPWKKETLGAFEAPASFVVPTELNNTGARAPQLATY